jgi:uncharacterized membrane protein
MVNLIIVGTVTWLHIISVIGWTGAALTFLVSIRSSLPKLSPQARGEFIVKVMPRFVRSVQVFTVLTVIFGPLLAYTMADGPPNQFNLVSPWSILVTIGASIGIAMFFVVFFLFTPTANNLVHIIKQMQQNPQQAPPSEFSALQKRLSMIPPLGVTLLLLAEVFMVSAAQF